MIDGFFRFPHTPHLAWLGDGAPRGDKVLSLDESTDLLAGEVTVEEKVDGANLGFSLDPSGRLQAQNRGQYLEPTAGGQFARLSSWLAVHEQALQRQLSPCCMAFGEWCVARHSVYYEHLPDWWLMFDLYDRESRVFQTPDMRNEFAANAGVATVVEIFRGRTTLRALERLLMSRSRYGRELMEGIVVRSANCSGSSLRAKLVRPDFAQAIDQHWRSRRIEFNRIGSSGREPGCQSNQG